MAYRRTYTRIKIDPKVNILPTLSAVEAYNDNGGTVTYEAYYLGSEAWAMLPVEPRACNLMQCSWITFCAINRANPAFEFTSAEFVPSKKQVMVRYYASEEVVDQYEEFLKSCGMTFQSHEGG